MKTLFLLPLLASLAAAQALSPSPSQHKKLLAQRGEILQLEFKISQLQAQAAFKIQQLGEMCGKVALENHWPLNLQCDQNTLLFNQPATQRPTPASVPEPPKKPE